MDTDKLKLKADQLSKSCNPSIFHFNNTAEIKPLEGIIGQERAERALSFGLAIQNDGYNIYLSGAYGTGKTTLAKALLEEKAQQEPAPDDWCYVHNFQVPDEPLMLQVPAGLGKTLRIDMQENMTAMIEQLVKALESSEYEKQKNTILSSMMDETNQLYVGLEEKTRKYGFSITRAPNGVSSYPLKGTEPLSQEEFIALSDEEKADVMRRGNIVQELINEAYQQYREIERKTKKLMRDLEQQTARNATDPFFSSLFNKYEPYERVHAYLLEVQKDVLSHLESFVGGEAEKQPMQMFRNMDRRSTLKRYQVNLLVDNSDQKCAPIVFETNPNFTRLFGQIEYAMEFGVLSTDFSRIKPGAIHKANGGYLVIRIYDLLKNFYVWDTLKRVIKNREIVIESLAKNLGMASTETLQPQPIPVNLKVILIGEPIYYYLLYDNDEEFQKLFKIRADFGMDMERSDEHIMDYARFISSVCEKDKLRHFTPEAVAKVVDYGTRMADDQSKMSTLFNKLVEIIYEANTWAEFEKKSLVDEGDVLKTLQEKKLRSSMMEEKIQEQIEKNTLIIHVEGNKVGEINGLAVYDMGDHSFGKPSRITAKTFMGEKGLINIEREIHMSGSIHSKGVLTLNGYLGSQYAQDKPLSLSASLTFEQTYGGIDGDSASSTELYAILSSLAEVPLKQGIAVTGSVNQNGEIQPVGGVNQKTPKARP